ncbi:MAG: DUF4328 domain-containing protein [Actinomycetes bacterium]
MEKISKWQRLLQIWVPICAVLSALAFIGQILYVQSLYDSGADPLGEYSTWDFALVVSLVQFLAGGIYILIIIFLAGFMLRSAQLIKQVSATEFQGKAGWAIWGFVVPFVNYFIPFRILRSIKNFAKYDEATSKKNMTLLFLFWMPFTVANLVDAQTLRRSLTDDAITFDSLSFQAWGDLVSALATLIASLALFWLIPALYKGIQHRMDVINTAPTDATS